MALSWYIVKAERSKPDSRCRKWRIVVRKKDGKTRSETFHGTKSDAKKRAPVFAAEVERECGQDGTFGAWLLSWNDARYRTGAIGRSSWLNYRHAAAAYSKTCAAEMSEVTPSIVDADTVRLLGKVKPSTARLYYILVLAAMDAAVRQGAMPSNPARLASTPKAPPREAAVLSREQADEILSWGVDDWRLFCVSLIYRTGMRYAEAHGVTWDGFDGRSIAVPRSATKTDAGARRIPVDASTAAYIEERRAYLAGLNGGVPGGARLVCLDDLATPNRRSVSAWWIVRRASLGFGGVRLHDLRHTYLTNLAQAGVHPSVMQRLAGHTTPLVAMRVYTHVNDADLAAAVDALAANRGIC